MGEVMDWRQRSIKTTDRTPPQVKARAGKRAGDIVLSVWKAMRPQIVLSLNLFEFKFSE